MKEERRTFIEEVKATATNQTTKECRQTKFNVTPTAH